MFPSLINTSSGVSVVFFQRKEIALLELEDSFHAEFGSVDLR